VCACRCLKKTVALLVKGKDGGNSSLPGGSSSSRDTFKLVPLLQALRAAALMALPHTAGVCAVVVGAIQSVKRVKSSDKLLCAFLYMASSC
jgi:hypothetical protein